MITYPAGLSLGDIADTLSELFNGIVVKPTDNPWENEILESATPRKLDIQNGSITLDVVITGHDIENIKVTWNDKTHVLKVVDMTDDGKNRMRDGSERPWYYLPLNLEFTLPETTDKKTFQKRFSNGVLTVNAEYVEKTTENVTAIEI